MRAEIIFNTPDPRVAITFPGFESVSLTAGQTWMIGGLPLDLAQELKKRWDFFDNQVGQGTRLPE